MLLRGRLALVTGAGQGNGAAIAIGIAREGARVVVTDLTLAAAERTAAAIHAAAAEAFAYALDVTDVESCREVATAVAARVGAVSLIVNNAGVCPRHTID